MASAKPWYTWNQDTRQPARWPVPGESALLVGQQGLGNVLISGELVPEVSLDEFRTENFVCHKMLGGLFKHYERKAA